MKVWNYTLNTTTLWGGFDLGQVEAETQQEALELAQEQIANGISKVNDALNHCDNTYGMRLEADLSQVTVEEVL